MNHDLIPAAQYLRMSTEHQQYSQQNQAAIIEEYAQRHHMIVTHTYCDAGRSGVVLKRRSGLCQLLSDVVGGHVPYKHILVYDVSRWGRFQDTDEAAHYEFVCKSAGIPVHYCAETFVNDGSLPNVIVKALKRLMAGEYSRELSVKVSEGMFRIAKLGFRTGGSPGYGFRRLLISSDRKPKQELAPGQRKSIVEDRVILIPGSEEEVSTVRKIFSMFVEEDLFPAKIARRLNQEGIPYSGKSRRYWYPQAVDRILKNSKYAGWHVYGRFSVKLNTRRKRIARSSWIERPNAWQPLVSHELFLDAQKKFADQTFHKKDEQILEQLGDLLREKGSLSERLVHQCCSLPSNATFRGRFGSLTEAFARVGHVSGKLQSTAARRKSRRFRDHLISRILEASSGELNVIQYNGHWRPKLRVRDGSLISIYVCRSSRTSGGELRWILESVPHERHCVSLIARFDADNHDLLDLHIVPDLLGTTRHTLKIQDQLLEKGERVVALSEVARVADNVRARLRQGD